MYVDILVYSRRYAAACIESSFRLHNVALAKEHWPCFDYFWSSIGSLLLSDRIPKMELTPFPHNVTKVLFFLQIILLILLIFCFLFEVLDEAGSRIYDVALHKHVKSFDTLLNWNPSWMDFASD